MSARARILAAVRDNRPAGDHPLPDLPDFPIDDGGDRVGLFLASLERMGGRAYGGDPAAPLDTIVDALCPGLRVFASAVPGLSGNRDLAAIAHPRELADVDVAVVRAEIAIAETGSVLLTDAGLGVNAVAYLAQALVVLLDPADIVAGVQAAYRRPEFHRHRYACLHTGPSATADIEGVLIHGAQGVRSLTVVLRPRARPGAPP